MADQQREWAVVAGATGAVGSGLVARLTAMDLGVVAVARTAGPLDSIVAQHDNIVACAADITTDDGRDRIASAIPGVVRAVVNSAGAPMGGTILDVTPEAIRAAIDIKVIGTLNLVRAVEEHVTTDSRIIAIGGNLGLDPIPEAATAGIGNAALGNAIRQLSRALGHRGVTCHIVAPGPIWTERLQSLLKDAAKVRGVPESQIADEFRQRSPIGHLVTVEEVVWAVASLLAPEARALAGGTLLLDAGQRTAIP